MKKFASVFIMALLLAGCGGEYTLPPYSNAGSNMPKTDDLTLACEAWTAERDASFLEVSILEKANSAAQSRNGIDNDALRSPAAHLAKAAYRADYYCNILPAKILRDAGKEDER